MENKDELIKNLKDKIDELTTDPLRRGYFALRHITNQQIEFLEGFNLKTEIVSNPKEDKQYDRAKAIWEGLKEMLLNIKTLKTELKIGDNEEKEFEAKTKVNPLEKAAGVNY